jgi:putative ABC transport system ATP-binding protein
MLTLKEVRKSYWIGPTEVAVLKGVSLDVFAGELVSIMGPSGCGKSTLMNIIGLLDRPTSGCVAFKGAEVVYADDDALSEIRNSSIGFVFQQYNLLARLTALENVIIPLIYRGESDAIMKERGMEILRRVGMADRAGHKPSELSGGQQQRIAIARALVGRPSLVLADEPTGALDARVGQEIMDLFHSLNSEDGITFVIITHNPGIASQCRRVAGLSDGIITE